MKRSSTTFLKSIIILIAVVAAFAMIRLPQTEGRAKDLDLFSIYNDPLIIYFYISSIPFFVGLYQTINLLSLMEQGKIFSKNAVSALLSIRNSALLLIVFIIGAGTFIRLNHASDDDPAGFLALCILTSVASGIVAIGSSVFAKLLQKKIKK